METAERTDVALPSGALTALRVALRREAGPLAAIHALQSAGYQVGGAVYDGFARWLNADPRALGARAFWGRLGAYMKHRGWGELEHDRVHPGVGLVRGRNWVEADGESGASQPTCAFSTGLFSGFLTRAAGAPVAVLEVRCISRGDEACAFAFGSESTIHDLYGLLLEGTELEQAIAEL